VDDPLTILVPARDEEHVIGTTVATLRRTFPDAEVIVADDGSRDGTADAAEAAGAIVLRLPRRGKGQALSAAERAAPPARCSSAMQISRESLGRSSTAVAISTSRRSRNARGEASGSRNASHEP